MADTGIRPTLELTPHKSHILKAGKGGKGRREKVTVFFFYPNGGQGQDFLALAASCAAFFALTISHSSCGRQTRWV